jgi:pimeloyl-ACP methyl ester carboxylesterase
MPGFGKSKGSRLAPLEFLERFVDMLQFPVEPIIIAPSYSGRFLLSLLAHGGSNINGAITIGPAFAEQAVKAGTLSNYKKPLLIVWGEEDVVFPVKTATSLHAAIPHSQLMIVPSAGHAAYIEQPKAFHDEMMDFLSRITWNPARAAL